MEQGYRFFLDSQSSSVLGRIPSESASVYGDSNPLSRMSSFSGVTGVNVFYTFPSGTHARGADRLASDLAGSGSGLIVIESWQYAAGTGMAQVTDVICNTLGAWIGGIAFQKRKHCL
ncbi:MAG: hypothetical protein ACLTTO_05990 [Lachnospiraceae bacterium]